MSLSQPAVGVDAMAALAMAALTAVLSTAIPYRSAFAQGGLVCNFGPADYRRCCKESYRRSPDLGVRERAEDIEACLKGSTAEEPAAEPGEDNRDSAAGRKPGESAPPPVAAPPQTPPVVLRSTGVSPIRRVDCTSESCEKGCSAAEMAISAFCKIGSFPTLTPEGAVRCASTGSASAMPIVLFCAKR